jgi:hypothetical protein
LLWEASWWGFDNSLIFQKLGKAQQKSLLAACNRTLLNEAYFIEKSGLAYTAKMSLLSNNTDSAQLYALIGADEARHLAWLEPYIADADKTRPYGRFLAFLSQLIEEAPPRLLVYLVQIILEGWGLDHYSRLAEGCQDPQLSEIFRQILKDEALHHKSGVLLFHPADLLPDEILTIKEALKSYTEMVRIGPYTVCMVLDSIVGGLSDEELQEVLIALRHPGESQRKLLLLKKLMRQPAMETVVDELDEAGYFLPLPLDQAAMAYRS